MNIWHKSTGLAQQLAGSLSEQQQELLSNAVTSFSVTSEGWAVPQAGQELWKSLCAEVDLPAPVSEAYSMLVKKLLENAGTVSLQCNCPHHRSLQMVLRENLRDNSGLPWLKTLFEVVAACDHGIRAALKSNEMVGDDVTLSRLMPLEKFIKIHLTSSCGPNTQALLHSRLRPGLTPAIRLRSLQSGLVGSLKGYVGGYFHWEGYELEREVWCSVIMPFATTTAFIENTYSRMDSPSSILEELGLPYAQGKYWVELQYMAKDAAIQFKEQSAPGLGIPSFIDAAGDWAFRPSRDEAKRWNYARNLKNNAHGAPEVIHNQVPVGSLKDAIVWNKPTDRSWGDVSPFVRKKIS